MNLRVALVLTAGCEFLLYRYLRRGAEAPTPHDTKLQETGRNAARIASSDAPAHATLEPYMPAPAVVW